MANLSDILVSGYSGSEIQALAAALRKLPRVHVKTRLLAPNEHDPLGAEAHGPAILIHFLGETAERELNTLIQRPPFLRPKLLVIGAAGGDAPHIMRLAMQAGARDFITHPIVYEEVAVEVRNILEEQATETPEQLSPLVFLGARGGSGVSTIAGGVAHIMAARLGLSTVLLDLDYQFGAHNFNLDLTSDKGLKEALDAAEGLDELALNAYLGKHSSSLRVLGVLPSQLLLPGEVNVYQVQRLLELLVHDYSHIVVDLPCCIDPLFGMVVENSHQIILVVQQDFVSLRNGQKITQILRGELQVPPERIGFVVNRYGANKSITLKDIEQALQLRKAGLIPSDYRNVLDAANLGIPLLDHAPKSPASLALLDLAKSLSGQQPARNPISGLIDKFRAAMAARG